MVEWTMEFLCAVELRYHCCFFPFHSVRPQKCLLYCRQGY